MYKIEGERDIVRKVVFKGGQREELRKFLTDEYQKAKNDREPLMKKAVLWLQQANSRRSREDARPGDSNVDMPLTKKRMIQNSSRLKNPILSQERMYACKPKVAKKESHELAISIENALDYIVSQFNVRDFLGDWIKQFQTISCGVTKTPFISEFEKFVYWEEIEPSEYEEFKTTGVAKVDRREFDTGEVKYFVEIEDKVEIRAGAFPEVVPFEDFIVPSGTCSVDLADVIYHRTCQSKKSIRRKIREGIYQEKDDDQKVTDRIGEPGYEHQPLIIHADDGRKDPGNADWARMNRHYEIVEAYLEWDTDDNEDENEIIVTFEANTGTILRAVHNFYQSYRRPFITHEYEHIIGSINGDPLTFALEPLHVANSASFNQRLDAASLANETLIFVPPHSSIERALSRSEFRTGVYQVNFDAGEAKQFSLSQNFNQLPDLEDKLERSADEVASLTPNSFGFEQVERPTAAGTIHLSEESKQPQYDQLERFRDKLALLALHMLSRYRQFFPEGLKYYLEKTDEQGAMALTQGFLQWPKHSIERDVVVKTKVSSASMSKSLRKQEMVALLGQLREIYREMLGLAQAASDIQNPAAPAAKSLLEGLQKAVENMMREFEIIDAELLNPDLTGGINISEQYQQNMQMAMQEIQRLQSLLGGGPPGPGNAGPPGPQPGMGGSPQAGGGQEGY